MKPLPLLSEELIEQLKADYPVKAHTWETPHDKIIWENAQASLVATLVYRASYANQRDLERYKGDSKTQYVQ